MDEQLEQTKIATKESSGNTLVEKIYISLITDFVFGVYEEDSRELTDIDPEDLTSDFVKYWNISVVAAKVAANGLSKEHEKENPYLRPSNSANLPGFSDR